MTNFDETKIDAAQQYFEYIIIIDVPNIFWTRFIQF